MRLALFDLDHTLIPFDSGMAWIGFLAGRGLLPAQAEADYLACCQGYVAGTRDIHDVHRQLVASFSGLGATHLAALQQAFAEAMAPRLTAAARALVQSHRQAGDLCAIVTATTRTVAAPFARLFNIDHLLSTEALQVDGRWTGDIAGHPCHGRFKLAHADDWLESLGFTLRSFDSSFFYSDAVSDIPLLEAVSTPVAVNPDSALQTHAQTRGWRVVMTR